MRPSAIGWALLSAILLFSPAHPALAERGGPAEFAPGEERVRRLPRAERSARMTQVRALERAQRAELDSLAVLLAAEPADARRWHGEIQAAKRRHARAEVELSRAFALRAGDAALARKLDARLARLAGREGAGR